MKKEILDFFAAIGLAANTDTSKFQMADSPIKKGDKVIGEMTELEKACMMLIDKNKADHSAFHKDLETKLENAEGPAELQKLLEEVKGFEEKCKGFEESSDLARSIMWRSVETRFSKEEGHGGFGFREGNKVVTLPKKIHPHIEVVTFALRELFRRD